MTIICADLVGSDGKNLEPRTESKLIETKIVKKKIAIVNFTAIVAALYLYDRHNRFCEPGVYSLFSFLEYIVIVANIIYHLQAYHDLADYSVIIANFTVAGGSNSNGKTVTATNALRSNLNDSKKSAIKCS